MRSGRAGSAAIRPRSASWIQVEQKPYQIVGVAQAGFTGTEPGVLTDVWLPNMMFQRETPRADTGTGCRSGAGSGPA